MKSRLERGQSLVEMTFGFLVLMILMSGLLDIGRLYYVYVALEDSAGEAALYMSIFPNGDLGTPTDTTTECGAMYESGWCRARYATNFSGTSTAVLDWSNIDTSSSAIYVPPGGGVGETVTVTLVYNYDFITPFIRDVFGNNIQLTSTAEQTIVSESS
jgi:Flp pilus assembly protein TadG